MKFDILNRWSGKVLFTAEIECDESAGFGVKVGLAVKWAIKIDADLSGADLRDADLSGADLRDVPKIENIHQAVYSAASAPGALDMRTWHEKPDEPETWLCGTSHCRAGWVIALAGSEGRALESKIGTPAAASLIYLASDPDLGEFPDFYCGNEAALADMEARAEAEAAR